MQLREAVPRSRPAEGRAERSPRPRHGFPRPLPDPVVERVRHPRQSGVEFVAWGAVAGRSRELADALGGGARCFFPPGATRPPVAVRWLASAVLTAWHVLRRRPSVLIVTNPPCLAGLVGLAVGRAVGSRVVLDSHPGAFGAQGDRVAARLQPLHRWITRRADLSIVASDHWRAEAEACGGKAVVVHEAPGSWRPSRPPREGRLRVLYVGRFADDEPWGEVLEAARRSPQVDVVVTGDARRAGVDPTSVPANVELVGFLDAAAYERAVHRADAVLTLTTEPGSVMRAACEAVWAGRPLVVSDWPALREVFPYALFVGNEAAAIAAGLEELRDRFDDLASATGAARRLQEARWDDQRSELGALLSLPGAGAGERPA